MYNLHNFAIYQRITQQDEAGCMMCTTKQALCYVNDLYWTLSVSWDSVNNMIRASGIWPYRLTASQQSTIYTSYYLHAKQKTNLQKT